MATLKTYLSLVIALLVLTPLSVATAGEISISAEIATASIAFDAKDTLKVNLIWEGEPFLYQIDDFPLPALEKLEILGSSSSVSTAIDSTVPAGEITTRTFRYILQPTDFGTGVISPLNLTAKNRTTGQAYELKTGRLTIEIAKPVPKKKSGSDNNIPFIILIVTAVIIGVAVVIVVIKKKSQRQIDIPADESYIDALKEIKKETISDKKLFYSRLYRLLLSYLEKERGLEVSGKTGEEVIRIVDQLDNDAEKAVFMQWINTAQKVKYRPEAPSSGDVENSYNAVFQFFENKLHKE